MKKTIALLMTLTLITATAAGCGYGSSGAPAAADTGVTAQTEAGETGKTGESGQEGTTAENGAPIADGMYQADFNTDGSMFHVNETKDGKGILIVSGGKMTIRAVLWVGYNGGTGTFNMSNGTLTVNNSLVSASKGTGRFFQGGGTVNANYYLTIGHNVGDGAYTITGGTLFVTNQNAHAIVGQQSGGKGLLDIAGGEAVIVGGVEVGNAAGVSATLRVRNGGRLVTPSIYKRRAA